MNKSNKFFIQSIAIVIFFFANTSLKSQNQCYIKLQDASGFSVSQSQINILETASCRLIDSLPQIYQDSFKVFDFGFYVYNEVMQGGVPEFFSLAMNSVQQQSKYYLLFGKQSDSKGIYTKYWIDLKLPNEDIFYCIDQLSPTLREELTQKFSLIANEIHESNDKSPYFFHESEKGTIDSLINYISDLKQCCAGQQRNLRSPSGCSPCAFSKVQFESMLVNEGLLGLQVESIVDETQPGMGTEEIGFKIKINNQMVDLDDAINYLKSQIHESFPEVTVKVYPFNYGQYCSNFAGLKNQFLTENVDLGILIGVVGENNSEGTVYWQMISRDASVPDPVPHTSDTCYYFNADKLYVRKESCSSGPRGIVENIENKGFDYEFAFADPIITPRTLTTGAVRDELDNIIYYQDTTSEPLTNRILNMTKPMIWSRLALGTAFEPKSFAPWSLYVGSSGMSAPFDFSTKDFFLDRVNYLFITDMRTEDEEFLVVAHDYRNMGNFLWGASAYIMGVPKWLAILGAHWNNAFGESGSGGWDSPDDQYSIKLGMYYAKRMGWKTVYAGRNNVFKN